MRLMARLGRGLGAGLIVVVAVAAGVGALYRLRAAGALPLGPHVPGALPLQQLAGGEAQPLARMALAWIPAGFVAGLALAWLGRLRGPARGLVAALVAAALLLLAGAASDAIAMSEPLAPHLAPQLNRAATWVAVALFAGAALVPARRRAR